MKLPRFDIKKLVTALLLVILTGSGHAANILAIDPTPSVSHQIVFQTLTMDLLDRGHNMTVLTPNPLRLNNSNLKEIDLSSSYGNFQKRFGYGMVKNYRSNSYGFMRTAFEIFVEVIEDQMKCPDMKRKITNLT